MISSAQINGHAKLEAGELFDNARKKSGSKMLAYAEIASAIGVSPGWFRKYINGYEAKEPKATVYENIRAAYADFCNRVEQENREDEQRLQALRSDRRARGESISQQTDC